MKRCEKCKREYEASSRHKLCPKCRSKLDRRPCKICGKLKQRKSKVCRKCFLQSKQYPYSQKRHKSKDGYLYVYYRAHPHSDKSGRLLEHRLIFEKKLGRYLLPFESIHHKNGVRSDNRIENLELWSKMQPAGARVKDLIEWAKKILKLYGGISSIGLEH